MPRQIAIVGAGPAGLYVLERLQKTDPDARIDVIDRLPVPFGLIRYGVAPDHQSTKQIARLLTRALERPNVSFIGGVEVGKHISINDLRAAYDAVVLAVGAGRDRRLGIPGEDLPGVLTSGQVTGWYNDLPDHRIALPEPVRDVVIIGAGNVALDVARIFAKSANEMAGSDLAPGRLPDWPLRRITIVARRGAADARFTVLEVEEIGRLARAQPLVDETELPPEAFGESAVLRSLRGYARQPRNDRPIALSFRFGLVPAAFAPGSVEFRSGGDIVTLPADLAVSCIGSEVIEMPGLPSADGVIANRDGLVSEGIYVVGWAGRGASGTIPTSRTQAHLIADQLLASVTAGDRPGRQALRATIEAAGATTFDMGDWKKIDAAERQRASAGRVRHKFARVAEIDAARCS